MTHFNHSTRSTMCFLLPIWGDEGQKRGKEESWGDGAKGETSRELLPHAGTSCGFH